MGGSQCEMYLTQKRRQCRFPAVAGDVPGCAPRASFSEGELVRNFQTGSLSHGLGWPSLMSSDRSLLQSWTDALKGWRALSWPLSLHWSQMT